MKYFIFQGNNHDCGFASLKMLLASLARDKSYLYLSKPLKRENYTVEELIKIAQDYGVRLTAFKCNNEFMLDVQPNSLALIDNSHVILIKKVTPKHVVYYDPGIGKVKLKHQDFIARWNNVFLEVEDYSKIKKIPKKRQQILPTKIRILESIISLVSAAILIGTFYLLNNVENAIFSLIILGVFATSQILENYVIYKEINFFDKTYINPYFYQKKNQCKQKYLEFIDFKQKYFTKNRGLLSSVLIAFLVTFLLCLNDFRNVFVLLVLILLKMLEILLFSKHDDSTKKTIAEYEEKCFDGKGEAASSAIKANELANNLVFQNSMKTIFYMIASFAFALIMMIITENSGCNYVIFHFVLYYLGANSFSTVISGLSNKKETEKNERYFLDSCNL